MKRLSLLLALVAALGVAPSAFSATITVTTDADVVAADTFCSLREAITSANSNNAAGSGCASGSGADTITFSFGAPSTISVGSDLPPIAGDLTIDATPVQVTGAPFVSIVPAVGAPTSIGLWSTSGTLTVKGLRVAGFSGRNTLVQGAGATIESSFLGTTATGDASVGTPGFASVDLQAPATIGGSAAAQGNVIAGTLLLGAGATGTVIEGNRIGTNAAGTAAIGRVPGLAIVGNTTQPAGVVVKGNTIGQGADVENTPGVRVSNNHIGLSSDGTAALSGAAGSNGIQLLNAPGFVLGGVDAPGNAISGNPGNGVRVSDTTGGTIFGNVVGLGANAIGSSTIASSTVVANGGDGVTLVGATSGIRIQQNAIDGNAQLGIDLGDDGVTANDPNDDITGGPNLLRNHPESVTAVRAGAGLLQVSGQYHTSPGVDGTFDFYVSPSCDASTHGEARRWLGSLGFSAPTGIANFGATFSSADVAPSVVTVTATDALGNTSELSRCAEIAAAGQTYVVTSGGDDGDGVCDANCELREAVNAANASPGRDTIAFAIGTGPVAIALNSALPAVTEPVTIDGTTQPGSQPAPRITLDGSSTGTSANGITVAAAGSGSTIRGLAIGRFGGFGIALRGNDAGSVVEGTLVGVRPDGTQIPNAAGGIQIDGSYGNRIGGTTSAQRVVVAANGPGPQILIHGGGLNTVAGSHVGVGPNGSTSYATADGIVVDGGSTGNTIGGDRSTGAGNLIYGLTGFGIELVGAGTGTLIQGNTIGLSLAGSTTDAPSVGVVVTDSPSTTIGDTTPPPGFPNPNRGNVLAGARPGAGDAGILVRGASAGTLVSGNLVGVDLAGAARPNTTGVSVTSPGVLVGPGNTIANNTDEGVRVSGAAATGVRIVANSIHDNGGTGISLLNGANGSLPAPVLTSVVKSETATSIVGRLTAPPGTYFVELFTNAACDPSGTGEGQFYSGFVSVTVGASGSASFSSAVGPIGPDAGVTVTATDSASNATSGFSNCRTDAGGLRTVSLEPVADTYVSGADVETSHGADATILVSPAPSNSCAGAGPAYGLLRFDLSSIPAGATIESARLELTATGGFADDGDPTFYAIRLGDDAWPESVLWGSRPADGIVMSTYPVEPTVNGVPLSTSPDVLGTSSAFNANCGASTLGEPRSFVAPAARPGSFSAAVAATVSGDKLLSMQIWGRPCGDASGGPCQSGGLKGYSLRYHAREAADAAVRPHLVITYSGVPSISGVSVSGPASVPAGAASVPLKDIPASALVTPQSTGTQAAPVNQSPVNQLPVNQLPVNQLPVNQSPVNQSPVNQLPVNQSPVNQSPVNQLGLQAGPTFADLALAPGPLGDTALSTIPVIRDGGWSAILAGTSLGTTPLQNVTLRQVFGLVPLPAALQPGASNPLRFADIDFSNSTIGTLPAMTLALGQLPLTGIPGIDWCTLFSGPPLNCATTSSGTTLAPSTSLLSAALAGAPVNQSPVNQSPVNQSLIDALAAAQAPVNQLPVNQLPVNQLPVNQLPVNQSRILSLPVNQLPVNQSPVNQLSLKGILLANAPVNQSPVNQLPVNQLPVNQSLIDCAVVAAAPSALTCATATLGQVASQKPDAINPNATLGDLRSALAPGDVPDTWTIADLQYYGTLIVGDLLKSLPQPNTLTLADVLALVLFANDPQTFSFETLNILDTGISRFASPPVDAPYRVGFSVDTDTSPAGTPWTSVVGVTLPRTFGVAVGTSRLVEGSSTCTTGAVPVADPKVTVSTGGASVARWSVPVLAGHSYTLCFTARPGIVLGPQALSVDVRSEGAASGTTAATSVVVADGTETAANNAPATSAPLDPSTFKLSYVTSEGDVDYFRIPVPVTGTRLTFHLSHVPTDLDLVVYGPQQVDLRPTSTTTPPLDGAPVLDQAVDLTHETDVLPSQTLDDLKLQSLPIVGVSALPGRDPEDVTVLSDGTAGSYVVQVTGFNGSAGDEPYMLRVTSEPPRAPANVPARTLGVGPTGTQLTSLPAGLNTLFVVNTQRLNGRYGTNGAAPVVNALSTTTRSAYAALGFPNAVLNVDAYPAVQSAYAAWDASPGNPDLANGVVKAINATVDAVRQLPNGAGLKYLVLVGGDEILPFARLGDYTVAANENGYASTFPTTTPLYAALHGGQMLSDDPYGTLEPLPYLDRQLYLPRLAVGRLVETPEEIAGTITRFTTFNGRLDPTTSLTTGYDFMQDGAKAIDAALATRLTTRQTLPLSLDALADWTKSLLVERMLPATGSPSITSLNGHADHFQFAPPLGAPYLTTGDLPVQAASPVGSDARLANRLVFSMGCHAGLSVTDAVVAGSSTYDWAQGYARSGVGAFLGNTGFGYGDSLRVAFSEQLDATFAVKIAAGSTVGNALVAAKQEYFGSLGVFGVYDEKAMAEFTLYGLPMWSVTTPGGGVAPASVDPPPAAGERTIQASPASANVVVTDAATGLEAEAFSLTGIADTAVSGGALGTYWQGPDGVQVTHQRPIQPKAFVELTGANGHGVLLTALTQQGDTAGVNPVFARPIIDSTAHEKEQGYADVAFPSRLSALRTYRNAGVLDQRVVLMTGQFFATGTPTVTGTGIQRLFTRMDGRVLRSASTDFAPPRFTRVQAATIPGPASGQVSATFAVDVSDPGGTVKRVLVAFRDPNAANPLVWQFVDLGTTGGTRWSGGAALSGSTGRFEYFVQAADAAGNVAWSSNKGFLYAAAPPVTQSAQIALTPSPAAGASGWFSPGPAGVAVTVLIDGGPAPTDGTVQVQVDGGAFAPYTGPVSVTGDGTHVVVARNAGGQRQLLVPIDTLPPVITIPPNAFTIGSTATPSVTCADAGIGTQSCTVSAIDTSTAGTRTFTVTAVDYLGHQSTAQGTYRVVSFTGFRAPVDNPPVANSVKAGSAVPVKFSLGANLGLDVFLAGSPSSAPYGCGSEPVDAIEETVTASTSGLQYDTGASQYTYVWKTEKAWAGTCRVLTLRFVDGTVKTARFALK